MAVKRVRRELEVEILRLHTVEKWPVGTIATQVGVHHQVIRRVLEQAGMPAPKQRPSPKMIDAYLPFVQETFEKYPRLRASRLWRMVCERGYAGSESHFRRLVMRYRPRPKAEAYLRLRMLPGEEAQVDWAHFGTVEVGRARRRLLGFVMTLSYSRRVFLRFFYDARMASFLRGHVDALEYFGGVPRRLLYDNLKSAVAERDGDVVRFNPKLLDFASHYNFAPRAAAPARGNEKGRVERSIRYIRDSFFAAREVGELDALNAAARTWCEEVADARAWPEDRSRTVTDAYTEERDKLLALPDNPFPAEERVEVRAQRTPYVRFDLNDYSVPHTYVRERLDLLASVERVRVVHGLEVVAEHVRSYDKGAQVEDEAHIEGLVLEKRRAKRQRGMGRLQHAAPASEVLLRRAAERGDNIGSIVSQLLTLLDAYGPGELEQALLECNAREVVHVTSVRQVLEQRRHAAGRTEPQPVSLDDPRLREIVVRPHDLETYAHLGVEGDEPAPDSDPASEPESDDDDR